MGYVKLVIKCPWLFILVPLLLALVLLMVLIFVTELPNFNEPRKGFENRRTLISSRSLAYQLLLKHSLGFSDFYNHGFQGQDSGDEEVDYENAYDNDTDDTIVHAEEGNGHFFCGKPDPGYIKLVFESKDGSSLMQLDNIKSMCLLEKQILDSNKDIFSKICDKIITIDSDENSCCRSWSLGNYVALLNGKSSCGDVSESDITHVTEVIRSCSNDGNYSTGSSSNNMSIYINCSNYATVVEDLVHYITDIQFSRNGFLKNSISFLPISQGVTSKDFYGGLQNTALTKDNVKIVALDFGLKQDIFDETLLRDTYLCMIGVACISLILFLYTRSLFVTVGTLLQIFVSLVFTYSAYRYLFRISFFPFLNMLAVVVLIATGVDNTFVIFHIWCQLKLQQAQQTTVLHEALSKTVNHAFKSLFVTSATTSAAFFSGYVSEVIVLKCFAIFSGTSLVIHFVVAALMLPAVIVLHVKYPLCDTFFKLDLNSFFTKFDNFFANIFQACIFQVVVKLKWFLVCLFSVVGLVSFVIVAVTPKLKLPSAGPLQLFVKSHPFEVYESKIKDRFFFENPLRDESNNMPLRFVWGIKPDESVDVIDPDKKGKIIYDKSFDMSTPRAQTFLLEFCQKVRMTEYYEPRPGPRLTDCFIEKFHFLMMRSCRDLHGNTLKPCCSSSKFPYSSKVFKKCLKEFLPKFARANLRGLVHKSSGLRFNANYTKIVALVVEFTSNQTYRPSYVELQKFFNSMNGFTDVQLQYNSPPEMKNGWFISDLEFYDLQHSLVVGTPISLFLSIAVTATFAFITTRNIITTGLAMVSISTSIMATIAIMVLDGWQLEVFESMSISLAVGMSIDYALHYGIAYQHVQGNTRHEKVIQTIRMSSAVAMAAATTFFVGFSLVTSVVLAYKQLAVFLMTVTSLSWFCSTFFYLSLLLLIGPRGTAKNLECCKYSVLFKTKSAIKSSDSCNSPNLSSTGTVATTMAVLQEKKNEEATELVGLSRSNN